MSQRIAVPSSYDVAEWLSERANAEGRALDGLRLQRLLFLAQAHFAAITGGARLMPSVFVSSEHGPVEPNLLRALQADSENNSTTAPVNAFLKGIWRAYGDTAPSLLDRQVVDCAAAQAAANQGINIEITIDAMAHSFEGAPQNGDLLAAMRAAGPSRSVGGDGATVAIPKVHRGKPVERWTPGTRRG